MVRKIIIKPIDNRATTSGQQQPTVNQISLPVKMKSELIKSLSRCIGLLHGQIIDDEERGNLIKNINIIIIKLTDFVLFESEALNIRNELLNNLVANKTSILTFDKLTTEKKMQLITGNNQLLIKIMNIRSENLVENDETDHGTTDHDEGDQSNINFKRMKKLSDDIESLKQSIRLDNIGLNDRITELKKIYNDSDIMRSQSSHSWNFELCQILSSDHRFYSSTFYCLGLKWRIELNKRISKEHGSDVAYLSVMLNCPDLIDDNCDVTVDYALGILDQTENTKHERLFGKARKFSHSNSYTWGLLKFIRISELTESDSVFVKNGSFTIWTQVSVPV